MLFKTRILYKRVPYSIIPIHTKSMPIDKYNMYHLIKTLMLVLDLGTQVCKVHHDVYI